jgi:hypothetical protein
MGFVNGVVLKVGAVRKTGSETDVMVHLVVTVDIF